MKNAKNIKKQKIYKIRRAVAVIVIALAILILILGMKQRNVIKKLALGEDALEMGQEVLDLSKVLSEEPNPPALGAGMIPIKWNGSNWVITTANDSEWYDYSKGKWPNIMLSDRLLQI